MWWETAHFYIISLINGLFVVNPGHGYIFRLVLTSLRMYWSTYCRSSVPLLPFLLHSHFHVISQKQTDQANMIFVVMEYPIPVSVKWTDYIYGEHVSWISRVSHNSLSVLLYFSCNKTLSFILWTCWLFLSTRVPPCLIVSLLRTQQ